MLVSATATRSYSTSKYVIPMAQVDRLVALLDVRDFKVGCFSVYVCSEVDNYLTDRHHFEIL